MRPNLKLGNIDWRSPSVYMRVVLGVLLLGNLIALWMLLFPPGGSLEEIEERLISLRQRSIQQGRSLEQMKTLQAKGS